MGRFAFLPRLSFLGRLPRLDLFCRVLIFSAATYSHVTVASSAVACINADISASCVLSCKKGWQDLLSPETRPIVVLACQSSRISANGKLQDLQKSSFRARIKCDGNFPLNFAVWQQPSRFLKAEIQICAFLQVFAPRLRGFAPCLRACFGPECISLSLKNCRWDWREKNTSANSR